VGHCVRLFRQVQQGLSDTASHVQEGKVTHFLGSDLQAASHLRGEAHQDVRVNLDQLAELLVGDLCHFTRGFRTNPGATLLALFKQAEFANKVALIEIRKDHFFPFFIFNQHGY
jgi:hypothetical protein